MDTLAGLLEQHQDRITDHLYLGYVGWDRLVARLKAQEREALPHFIDEQVWTFLMACGYAVAGEKGVTALTKAMTCSTQEMPAHPKIWLEVLPLPPREKEGSTHIDLALGTIALRSGTKSGIELDAAESPWICFCEAKWYSDITTYVTHDPFRNQLLRVIENAVCFKGAGVHADKVCVTLLTPEVFRNPDRKSRLYQYKFGEYKDRDLLRKELNGYPWKGGEPRDWTHSTDLEERIAKLVLRRCTYDELFGKMPDSPLAAGLEKFWKAHGVVEDDLI
jgi:hypothetical protein